MSLRAADFEPGAPVAKAAGRVHRMGRVHRIVDDDELPPETDGNGHAQPEIQPFVAADAKGDLITAQGEAAMPRGIYKRKPRADKPPGAPTSDATTSKKRKAPRRAPRAKTGPERRFGVFDDGSIQINTTECKGNLLPEEAADLVAFITSRKRK